MVGQASSTTRPPGSLNDETIFSTSAGGHPASRSIEVGPAVQTVAGVDVDAEPRDRERVPEVGLPGLGRVVAGAVGHGRRSPPRRLPGRGGVGRVVPVRMALRRRREWRRGWSGWVTGAPFTGWVRPGDVRR